MDNFTKIQDGKTKEIKVFIYNNKKVSEQEYNDRFYNCLSDPTKNYNSSFVTRNQQTGNYLHKASFN